MPAWHWPIGSIQPSMFLMNRRPDKLRKVSGPESSLSHGIGEKANVWAENNQKPAARTAKKERLVGAPVSRRPITAASRQDVPVIRSEVP